MAHDTAPDSKRILLRILDEDDSAQRYPLAALLQAVQAALGFEVETWRIFRAWGQGPRTAQLTDALDGVDVADEMGITTETLLDLDSDPNEWFFDVIIRTSDRSLSFGIFDSGCMFVEGPHDLALQIGRSFEQVTEHDSSTAPPAIRGDV